MGWMHGLSIRINGCRLSKPPAGRIRREGGGTEVTERNQRYVSRMSFRACCKLQANLWSWLSRVYSARRALNNESIIESSDCINLFYEILSTHQPSWLFDGYCLIVIKQVTSWDVELGLNNQLNLTKIIETLYDAHLRSLTVKIYIFFFSQSPERNANA